jgi:NAD(P)H-nitrite reductase large subunit
LATGAVPLKPDIPGIDKPFVFTEDDYLEGKAKIGSSVVVLGGKWGAETAVSLAREKDVDNGISSINRGIEEMSTRFIVEPPPFLAGKRVMVRSEFLL